jgi:NAD(P)-dependent dehydrogenase (short-subunit alcohol dehydrogenase family)
MDRFACASGDRNPLHAERAAGETRRHEAPIVYGVLSVLAAIGAAQVAPGRALCRVDASFSHPLFVGCEYELEVIERDDVHASIRILDSDLRAFTIGASFAVDGGGARAAGGDASPRALAWLRERFRLSPRGVSDYALQGLLYASYLIGMELPGRGATMLRLRLALAPPAIGSSEPAAGAAAATGCARGAVGPLSCRSWLADLEQETGIASVASVLRDGERIVARLTCQAQPAPVPARPDMRRLIASTGVSDRLEGRVAVVVGASRGLGAALAQGLAAQDCAVYACSRGGGGEVAGDSRGAGGGAAGESRGAGAYEGACGGRGSIEPVRGDAGEPGFCRDLLARIVARHEGVDFLVCCAAPSLGAIGFGPASMSRFNGFVERSVALVTVPMATFLRAVQARAGSCLLVSSTAVTTLPRDWGHYVAAKAAGEAVAVWSARRFPEIEMVVARVPRLSGSGTGAGLGVEEVAGRLVDRLARSEGAGVHLVEW